jgi:hypothetical protein
MFVQDADMACLRQGDIVAGIPFPLLGLKEVLILATMLPERSEVALPILAPSTRVHRDDPNWLTCQMPVRLSFCAVVSQCCDLEPRYGKILMPSFAVARLIPVPARIVADPQRLSSLRENKDPRNVADPGYVNLFHVPAHERVDGKEWVVNYNQMIAIPGSEFPAIVKRKVLQMEDQWRVKFKIKLAASLSRLTEEERDAGFENPWRLQ